MSNSTQSSTEQERSSNQKPKNNGFDAASSGDSASTVSSGEHLNDLCLSPSDIFDIEHPGAGTEWVRFALFSPSIQISFVFV